MLYASLPLSGAVVSVAILVGRLLLFFSCFLSLAVKIEAEVGFGSSAIDFEGNLSACSILVKEGIDWFEQDGLPTSCHLRQLGIEPEQPVKIECSAVQCIAPGHVSVRAGDLKV